MEVTKNSMFTNETVIVKYILKFDNKISDKKHPLYGGLTNKAVIGIPAPLYNGSLATIFTKEELAILGDELNEDLNIRGEFWKEYRKDENGMSVGIFPIFLGKDALILNKENPEDYIKIKILENSPIVAKSEEDAKRRQTEVKFIMFNKADEHKNEIDNINYKREAYKLYEKVESNVEVLSYILRSFGKGVDSHSSEDFIKTQTWGLMEHNPKLFVEIVSDKHLLTKIKIYHFTVHNLINKVKDLYYTEDGSKLAIDGEINDLNGASRYLDSGIGSELKLELEAKLKTVKK